MTKNFTDVISAYYTTSMTKKLIEFATDMPYLELPKPARRTVPDWYKKAEKFIGGKQILNNQSVTGSKTIKVCMPFFDTLTAGYVVELAQDVQVSRGPMGETILGWGVAEIPVAEQRPIEIMQGYPIPDSFAEEAFAWKFDYCYKTPVGYSVLVTHPLNRYDVPFITLSGITDADNVVNKGNLPFLIKKDFEGIIPAGTPIAQLIPFKRDNWQSKENKDLIAEGKKNNFLSRRTAFGWYKRTQWSRKNYS